MAPPGRQGRVALAPAGVMLQGARHDHAGHRRLDDVRVGGGHPPGRVEDLVPVARELLPAGVGAEREPQREAPEDAPGHGRLPHRVLAAAQRMKPGEHCNAGSRRTQEPERPLGPHLRARGA